MRSRTSLIVGPTTLGVAMKAKGFRTLSARSARLRQDSSGSAFVEAALILPVAIAFMAGAVEFGRLMASYMTVEESIRSATRYLSRVPGAAVSGWGLSQAKNIALTGTTNGS